MVANLVIGAARLLLPSVFRVAARNPIKTGLALDGIFNGFAGTKSLGTSTAQFVGKQALGFLGLNGENGVLSGLTNKFNDLAGGINSLFGYEKDAKTGKFIAGALTLAIGGTLASSLMSGNYMQLAMVAAIGMIAYSYLSADKSPTPALAAAPALTPTS